jgi:TonB family protein
MRMPLLAGVFAAACTAAEGQLLLFGPYEAERLIVYREPVRLPPEVEQLGIRGEVRVSVEVSPEGRVRRAELVSGHPLLAGPALKALRRYRFRPVEVHGQPAAWRGLLRIPVPGPAPRQDPRQARCVPAAGAVTAPG